MNNDNIIEEKDHIDRFAEVAKGLGLEKEIANKIANFVHYEVMHAKKSAEQAGYTRAMGEAREKMLRRILPSKYEHLPEHARAGAVFQDCLSCLTPTDNNKEDNPK